MNEKDNDWWEKLSEKEQKDYLTQHPKSKKKFSERITELSTATINAAREKLKGNAFLSKLLSKNTNPDDSPKDKDTEKEIKDVKVKNENKIPISDKITNLAAAAFVVAGVLALFEPSLASTIFNSAYLVATAVVKYKEDNTDTEYYKNNDTKDRDENTESPLPLTPDELDQRSDRERDMKNVNLDADGNEINKSETKSSSDNTLENDLDLILNLFQKYIKEQNEHR